MYNLRDLDFILKNNKKTDFYINNYIDDNN